MLSDARSSHSADGAADSAAPSGSRPWRGRGRRGRGRGTGRPGTGRAHGRLIPQIPQSPSPVLSPSAYQPKSSKKRPTHFLCLPLGHHPALRSRISAFQNVLLQNTPAIPGIDPSIMINPRRLHLTLGVMALDPSPPASNADTVNTTNGPKTLTAALTLLHSLKPHITRALLSSQPPQQQHKLRVALDKMDIMNPDRGDVEKAHVLWVGPDEALEEAQRLRVVCDVVHRAFQDAGFIVDRRPLMLHCTILNTTYRRARRIPFSYSGVLGSSAGRLIGAADSQSPPWGTQQGSASGPATQYTSSHSSTSPSPRAPVPVTLGVWDIDEIQICTMGSHGPEDEYVSCGGISVS